MAIGSSLTKIPVMYRITLLYIYHTRFRALESIAMKIIVPSMANVATNPIPDVSAPMMKPIDFIVNTPNPTTRAARKMAPMTPSGSCQKVFDLYPSIDDINAKGVIQYSVRQAGSG